MGNLRTIIRNWDNKDWWRRVAIPYFMRQAHSLFSHTGVDILTKDWDNLIILDACRFDVFEENNTIEGELSKIKSNAANTQEFLIKNFSGTTCHDIVYVTANPQVNVHLNKDIFHKVINVWEDHWNDDLHTVTPQRMAAQTLLACQYYPNKRIIAHFIQPHYPFIGEIGQKQLDTHAGMELSKRSASGSEARRDNKSVWEQLYERSISESTAWRAYVENLKLTIPNIKKLIMELSGKTVITSDHGNAFGEPGWPIPLSVYGHPPNIHIPAIVEVPWLITNKGERKRIVSEEPVEAEEPSSSKVQKRLSNLGYR